MTVKGWNDNPIAHRVIGLDQNYFVITKQIQCQKIPNSETSGCGKSMNYYVKYLKAVQKDIKLKKRLGYEVQSYQPFSNFDNQSAYAGFYPSRWYINCIYMDYMEHIRPALDQCLSALTDYVIFSTGISGSGPQKTALIQLALPKSVYLLHVY